MERDALPGILAACFLVQEEAPAWLIHQELDYNIHRIRSILNSLYKSGTPLHVKAP
jgi:hypothetical protein